MKLLILHMIVDPLLVMGSFQRPAADFPSA